jgi:hypothetical protein
MRVLVGGCFLSLFFCSAAARSENAEPLRQIQVIPMPGVEGRIDHLAVDLEGRRLFVAALENKTVEVLDLAAGKVVARIKDLPEPQGIAYLADLGRLCVACGGDGSCRFFDGKSLAPLKSIEFGDDADNLRYDRTARRLYVGFGAGAIGTMDAVAMTKLGEAKLKAHPESFQMEARGSRIFVNVPNAREIAVVDREKMAVVADWLVREAAANFPMALDEANRRLFLGCRKPARILVLNTESGAVVREIECAGDLDDIFHDAKRKRLYAAGGEGAIDVFDARESNRFDRLARIPTSPGARTALFAPDLDLLLLAVPHRGSQGAEIRVFRPDTVR